MVPDRPKFGSSRQPNLRRGWTARRIARYTLIHIIPTLRFSLRKLILQTVHPDPCMVRGPRLGPRDWEWVLDPLTEADMLCKVTVLERWLLSFCSWRNGLYI